MKKFTALFTVNTEKDELMRAQEYINNHLNNDAIKQLFQPLLNEKIPLDKYNRNTDSEFNIEITKVKITYGKTKQECTIEIKSIVSETRSQGNFLSTLNETPNKSVKVSIPISDIHQYAEFQQSIDKLKKTIYQDGNTQPERELRSQLMDKLLKLLREDQEEIVRSKSLDELQNMALTLKHRKNVGALTQDEQNLVNIINPYLTIRQESAKQIDKRINSDTSDNTHPIKYNR